MALRFVILLASLTGLALGQTSIRPPLGDADDLFGQAVAIDGHFAVIGTPGESSNAETNSSPSSDNSLNLSGAAYVYQFSEGLWQLQTFLKASDRDFEDRFGSSVAISGDTIAIGAPTKAASGNDSFFPLPAGAVYIFRKNGDTWVEEQKLIGTNTGGSDNFGGSVAIDGNTVVVGARFESSNATGVNGDATNDNSIDSGAAYVFQRTNNQWSQQAYLKASNTDAIDLFGSSVSIQGNTIFIGAPGEDSLPGVPTSDSLPESGAVYVFSFNDTTWQQTSILKPHAAIQGDLFGSAVAQLDSTAIIGARGNDAVASSAGAAFIFHESDQSWNENSRILPTDTSANSEFGSRVDIAHDRILVGAPRQSALGANTGAAYSFVKTATTWVSEFFYTNPEGGAGDEFGQGVAIGGNRIIISAPRNDGINNTVPESGVISTRTLNSASFPSWLIDQSIPVETSGETDDPDGDGISNLLSYAFAITPGSGDMTRLPRYDSAIHGVSFSFPENIPKDIFYLWLKSSNLSTWLAIAEYQDGAWIGPVADTVMVSPSSINLPFDSKEKQFLRLQVNRVSTDFPNN